MREVGWFFFPLLLNVQMMSISHSVINAALARMTDAVAALAAFSGRWGCTSSSLPHPTRTTPLPSPWSAAASRFAPPPCLSC
jgi:hypothetical protein